MNPQLLDIVRVFLRTLVFVCFATSSYAGIVNGDYFDGSTGWSVSDPTFASFAGGQATIYEHTFDNEVLLWQQFTMPADSATLSFQLINVVSEPDSGFLPDAFNVSLLDPNSLVSLVPTVDVFSDAFYTRDLLDSVTQGVSASGVTLTPAATSLPLTVHLNISALSQQDVILQFKLIGGGIDYSSSVTLDNVHLTAVPEPSSCLLFASGLALLSSLRVQRPRVDIQG